MGHKHPVYDTDIHFSINPTTREITTTDKIKTIIQGDHNSERFSFDLPKTIDGHDMTQCNRVRIHFINVDGSNRDRKNADIYIVNDMAELENKSDTLVLTWLVSGNATQYAGSLNFIIEFSCVSDDNKVDYVWHTAICNKLSISGGMSNAETIMVDYPDILEQWKNEVITRMFENLRAELPTKVSQLENDKGYLTEYTETDPTVPAWAKEETKPTYTAEEVGADPKGYADTKIADHNVSEDAHSDIRLLFTELSSRFNALADSDDETLDQLSEVIKYIKSNKSLIDAITTEKISYSDIVDDLVTNAPDKPLSAAQGVVLKALFDNIPAWAKEETKPTYTAEEVGADTAGTATAEVSDHNTSVEAHGDIRLLITGLTMRLNALLDTDDTTLDQLSEIINYIKDNRGLIESITTSKVSVADIIDNLDTNAPDKPLSAAQGVVLKNMFSAGTTKEHNHDDVYAAKGHNHDDVYAAKTAVSNIETQLATKAAKADIATTVMQGSASQSTTYWKVHDFGEWGSGDWMSRGFSMLLSSRAGEMIWVSLAANDSSTSAGAFRLIDRYSKISAIHYSLSEHALYVTQAAWANNLCAHILSNVKGDYVPKINNATGLPSDAVQIPIIPFGINGDGNVAIGNSTGTLEMGGSADRPTYNGNNMALSNDVPSNTETWTFTLEDGTEVTKVVYVG